jgi:hypothetical protein
MLDHDMFEGKLVAARLSDNSELSFGRRHFGAAHPRPRQKLRTNADRVSRSNNTRRRVRIAL